MKLSNLKLLHCAVIFFTITVFWSLCSPNTARAGNGEIRIKIPLGYSQKFAKIYECPAIFYASALLIEKDRALKGSGGDKNWFKKRELQFDQGCQLVWRGFTLDYIETRKSSHLYEISQGGGSVLLEYFWEQNEAAIYLTALTMISSTIDNLIAEYSIKISINNDAYDKMLRDIFQKVDEVAVKLNDDNPTTIAIFLRGAVEHYGMSGKSNSEPLFWVGADYNLYYIYKELVTLILCLSFLFFIIKRFGR